MPRRAASALWETALAFNANKGFTMAAAIAFYTGLSLAPLMLLFLWASSSFGSTLQEDLVTEVVKLVGADGGKAVRLVIENAEARVDLRNVAGLISLATLLVSATAVFAQLQESLNTIWGVKANPKISILYWLRKRLLSLGLVLSIGFLLLVSLILSAWTAALAVKLGGFVPYGDLVRPVADVVVPLLVYFGVFSLMMRFLPDVQIEWRDVWRGSLLTAGLFVIGKWLIGLYLGTRGVGSAYGAAGSLIVLLLWTYYSSAIVLFGSELTALIARRRSAVIEVEEIAEPIDAAP